MNKAGKNRLKWNLALSTCAHTHTHTRGQTKRASEQAKHGIFTSVFYFANKLMFTISVKKQLSIEKYTIH